MNRRRGAAPLLRLRRGAAPLLRLRRGAAPLLRLRRGAARLLPAAAGALQTLAFVHTALWPLPIAGAALLAWTVARSAPWRAALAGWAYGTGWLVTGTAWLYISMHRYGDVAAPFAALAVLVLAAALSRYLGAACWAAARWRRGRAGADAALFAALWLAAELARGVLLTGFPWVASGYAMVDAPLAVLAPYLGVYGIGAAVAFVAALAATARAVPVAVAVAALAVAWLAPRADFSAASGTLQVALLQTDVPQDEKFDPSRAAVAMAALEATLAATRADLVVTPETAVPLLPSQLAELAPDYWPSLVALFPRGGGRAALVGVPLGDFEAGYTNSVVGLPGDYRYDKLHLVPFGEFIPPGFRWFVDTMAIPLGDFARGVPNPPSFAVRGERVAPNVCYEDLFGEELARRFADPASAPTVFANVSNIGWFGDSWAIPQHLNISRLRTLEFQRPMLRATNTGATAVVDHRGRVAAALPPLTAGVLDARVEGRTGTTPYAWWAARFGLAPLALAAAATAAFAFWRRPR